MYCPNCGHPQYCGCKNCNETNKQRYDPFIPYVWLDGELVMCAKCGLLTFPEFWENLSFDIEKAFESKEKYLLERHNYQMKNRTDLIEHLTEN